MNAILIVLAAVGVGLFVAGVVTAVASYLRPLRGREVTVNTRRPDDQSIRGVLVREGRYLELRNARYLTREGETPIEGTAHVPRDNVAFVQEH